MSVHHTGGAQVWSRLDRAHETPPVLGKETSSAVRSCTTWHSRHWRLLYRRLVAMLAHLGERVLTLRVSYFCRLVICDTQSYFLPAIRGARFTPRQLPCGIHGDRPRSNGEARKGRDSIYTPPRPFSKLLDLLSGHKHQQEHEPYKNPHHRPSFLSGVYHTLRYERGERVGIGERVNLSSCEARTYLGLGIPKSKSIFRYCSFGTIVPMESIT